MAPRFKVASIIGARPQFVKASVVSARLRARCDEVLIHTGQHYDYCMSDVFFKELRIPEPDYNLEVGSGQHGEQTGLMLTMIERTLGKVRPDAVLVYGDTNSTLAGALAAAKMKIPVAHVEAGLRSFNRDMPEEINRVMTDHVAQLLFAPTAAAVENLAGEGVTRGVVQTGDVMCDAIVAAKDRASERGEKLCERYGIEPGQYVLCTIHRAGNTDIVSNLEGILSGLGDVEMPVIVPCHPRTRRVIEDGDFDVPPNVQLIDPLSYVETIALEMEAAVVATDSGGMQKEAYILGVPCVTLREETEWVETVEAGWNVLVGADREMIAEALAGFRPSGAREDLYGDGTAGEIIASRMEGWLQGSLGQEGESAVEGPPFEEIKDGEARIALIVRGAFSEAGVHFFSPPDFSQQLGFIKHRRGHLIEPHVHNLVPREVLYTQEALFVRKGRVRVDLYTEGRAPLTQRVLGAGDVILLAGGGHGFEVLEDCEMIEVKQGPYAGDADKVRLEEAARDTSE